MKDSRGKKILFFEKISKNLVRYKFENNFAGLSKYLYRIYIIILKR